MKETKTLLAIARTFERQGYPRAAALEAAVVLLGSKRPEPQRAAARFAASMTFRATEELARELKEQAAAEDISLGRLLHRLVIRGLEAEREP